MQDTAGPQGQYDQCGQRSHNLLARSCTYMHQAVRAMTLAAACILGLLHVHITGQLTGQLTVCTSLGIQFLLLQALNYKCLFGIQPVASRLPPPCAFHFNKCRFPGATRKVSSLRMVGPTDTQLTCALDCYNRLPPSKYVFLPRWIPIASQRLTLGLVAGYLQRLVSPCASDYCLEISIIFLLRAAL